MCRACGGVILKHGFAWELWSCMSVKQSVGWWSPSFSRCLILPRSSCPIAWGEMEFSIVVPHPPCVWPPCYEASALGAPFLPFWWEGESEVFTVLRGGLCSATSACSEGSLYMATEGNGGEQREIDVILGNNRRTQINYCLINSARIQIQMQMETTCSRLSKCETEWNISFQNKNSGLVYSLPCCSKAV